MFLARRTREAFRRKTRSYPHASVDTSSFPATRQKRVQVLNCWGHDVAQSQCIYIGKPSKVIRTPAKERRKTWLLFTTYPEVTKPATIRALDYAGIRTDRRSYFS